MSIISASKSWETGTPYQLARAHLKGQAAQSEKATAPGEEKTESEKAVVKNPETKECQTNTDVFLPSEKEQESNLFSVPSGISSGRQDDDSDSPRIHSSSPEDSVGQLAAMLARAETKLDVQQVSGKAMRALVNLKAAAANAKGDEAKKIASQIRRMEKLMKRIEKKLKHLSKEEQLEIERKRAVEKEEKAKADQISDELKTRRKKRRRDEKNYAAKELAEDQKESSSETLAAFSGTGGVPLSSVDAMSAMDASMAADLGTASIDTGSLDITV